MSAHVSAPHVISRSTLVHLSLQARSNVSLEYITVLGQCCPSGRDFSLNLFVLVVIPGAVSLSSQVDVTFNVLDLRVVNIYWCVVSHNYLCLLHVPIQTLIFTFISEFL